MLIIAYVAGFLYLERRKSDRGRGGGDKEPRLSSSCAAAGPCVMRAHGDLPDGEVSSPRHGRSERRRRRL